MPCVVLPYGTGNDLARSTNWGGEPSGNVYLNLKNLMREICENSREEKLNIWSVKVSFKEKGGNTFEVDSRTRNLVGKGNIPFERDMINYFGLGEDGKIGMGFERRRTASRCCNKTWYVIYGAYLFISCYRGNTIAENIEYMRTLDKK